MFSDARAFAAAALAVPANASPASPASSAAASAASVQAAPRKTSVSTSRRRSVPVSTAASPAFVLSIRPSPSSSVDAQ